MPNTIAVAKFVASRLPAFPSGTTAPISEIAIGSTMMVVAVLVIHMLKNAVANILPATRFVGRPPKHMMV